MASAADGALNLETAGLTAPEQAFSNALYVHPLDFAKIAEIAGADAERVKDAGVLCAVGEAVFFIRQSASYKPGSIGAGMMQRLAGQLVLNKPTPVTPFFPPRGNFPLASVVAEVDLVSGAPPPGQVRCCLNLSSRCAGDSLSPLRFGPSPLAVQFVTIDKGELAQFLQSTYHKHVFKVGQQFAANFKGTVKVKVTLREFSYLDIGAGGGAAELPIGQLLRETDFELRSKNPGIKFEGSSAGKANQVFKSGFNFLDLGIGGLNKGAPDAEAGDLFRSA